MVKTTLEIVKPLHFNFKRTVRSHGWCNLLPFALDQENWTLTRVFALTNRAPVLVEIRDAENLIKIIAAERLNETEAEQILRSASHVLQLDADFTDFYRLVETETEFAWIAQNGAGRLLRSPTVFEDLVKSICTTNCSWALTTIMTANLVQKLGAATSDDLHKDFPTAAAMAAQTVDFYKNEIRAGYRAAYLKELADKVAGGELDVEGWLDKDLPTAELKNEIKRVKGVGDYAAENLLKLLGRYDGLALDSFLRGWFARTHNAGEKCDDQTIHRYYERFGKWRGLALWCDATKEWL